MKHLITVMLILNLNLLTKSMIFCLLLLEFLIDPLYSPLLLFLGQTLTGVSLDYVHDVLKVPFSYLLELRPPPSNPIGFLLPADQIAPTTQEVFCGILEMLKKVDELV